MEELPTVHYKLLKDLPNVTAGDIFEGTPDFVDVVNIRGEIYRYHKKYIDKFDEWFEVVKEDKSKE